MIIKIAGFVLVGSVAALAGIGIADLAGYEMRESRSFRKHDFDRHEYVVGYRGGRRERHERRRVHVERAISVAEVEAGQAHVLGTYRFNAKGDVLNKIQWGASIELELQPGNRYRLLVLTKADGNLEEETSWGYYSVRGHRLELISAHDNDRQEFTIDGERLQFDANWKQKLALNAIGVDDAYLAKVHE